MNNRLIMNSKKATVSIIIFVSTLIYSAVVGLVTMYIAFSTPEHTELILNYGRWLVLIPSTLGNVMGIGYVVSQAYAERPDYIDPEFREIAKEQYIDRYAIDAPQPNTPPNTQQTPPSYVGQALP